MNPREYEIAFFAQTCWRLGQSSDTDQLIAIACTIRNHVVPRLGQMTTYKTFYDACLDFLTTYPLRPLPDITDPAFCAPEGLLFHITDIYNCTMQDTTAPHDHPNGAKYFYTPEDWFRIEIVERPALHPLIGNFGGRAFYA